MDSSPWTFAQCTHEDRPLLVRHRQLPPDFPRWTYPNRLNVLWQMREPDDHGLGTTSEILRMSTFEDRLAAAVEDSDAQSILSVILTTAGRREFVLHTADVRGFLDRLGAMPHDDGEDYPIEIHANVDPEWAYDDSVTPD